MTGERDARALSRNPFQLPKEPEKLPERDRSHSLLKGTMKLAMIGLGRMGANMARRLLRDGHEVVGYNRTYSVAEGLASDGLRPAKTLKEACTALEAPRVVWMMLPAGEPTEACVRELAELLEPGDVVVDGANSYFKDDVRRAAFMKEHGIRYADAGTSGGVWGLERGYCLMVGAGKETFELLEPALRTLAPGRGDVAESPGREGRRSTAAQGYLHCGPVGAGHFVKMVHNGIEYGLMQAYAEGFELMKSADTGALPEELRYDLDLADVAELWRRGSVIGSWLLDLTAIALAEDPAFESYSGFVQDSGEGRWTVQAAIDEAVPADVLTTALFKRFRSRQQAPFADKALSAMRKMFGGHVEPPKGDAR